MNLKYVQFLSHQVLRFPDYSSRGMKSTLTCLEKASHYVVKNQMFIIIDL